MFWKKSPPPIQFTVHAIRVAYTTRTPVVVTVLAHDFEDAAARVRKDHEDGDGWNDFKRTEVVSVRRDRR